MWRASCGVEGYEHQARGDGQHPRALGVLALGPGFLPGPTWRTRARSLARVHVQTPQGPHSRDSRGDLREVQGHRVQAQHLLPQGTQPGVNGGIGPRERTLVGYWQMAYLPPTAVRKPCGPHSPQLMLVISKACRQEGAASELKQPAVQLLGHKIESAEVERLGGACTAAQDAPGPRSPRSSW